MKRLFQAFGFIAVAILFVSCSSTDDNIVRPTPSGRDSLEGYATIWTEEEVYPVGVDEIKVFVENLSGGEMGVGSTFYCQEYSEGEWLTIPFNNTAYNPLDIGHPMGTTIMPNTVKMSMLNSDLKEGRYRILQSVRIEFDDETSLDGFLPVEFQIQ